MNTNTGMEDTSELTSVTPLPPNSPDQSDQGDGSEPEGAKETPGTADAKPPSDSNPDCSTFEYPGGAGTADPKVENVGDQVKDSEPSSLEAATENFGKAWASAAESDIWANYAVAEQADAVRMKYRRKGMVALAKKINRSVSLVYSYTALIKRFTRGGLKKLLEEAAGSLEWSHLILLSTKRAEAKRADLLMQIINEKMSSTKLKDILYPEGTSKNFDPDLIESGVVEDEELDESDDDGDPEDDGDDEADEAMADVDSNDDDAEGVEKADESLTPTNGAADAKGALSSRARDLRHFTKEVSNLAGQTKLMSEQVFEGFEEAIAQEKDNDTLTVTLEDLVKAKATGEEMEETFKANNKKFDTMMAALKAEIAKRTDSSPPAPDKGSVQTAGKSAVN